MLEERHGKRTSKSNQLTKSRPVSVDATRTSETGNSQRSKRNKRRRSLFAVLFNQNGESFSEEEDDNDEEQLMKSSSYGQNSGSYQRTRRQLRPDETCDIVLIKPSEAKCVEATVNSLVSGSENQARTDGEMAPVSSSVNQRANQTRRLDRKGSSSTSFTERMRHHFKRRNKSAAESNCDDDASSYVLDLNECINRRKLEMLSSSSSSRCSSPFSCSSPISSPFSSISSISAVRRAKPHLPMETASSAVEQQVEECSPLRETSPIEGLWQANREYIPVGETNNNNRSSSNNNNNNNNRSPSVRLDRKQASPTLLEFLTSHQIQMNAAKSLSRSSTSLSSSQLNSSQGSLNCAPNPLMNRSANLPAMSYYDQLLANAPLDPIKLNELSESDRRLYHWRKLAARSVSMWQVPEDSSSADEDSGSELVDCRTNPATVCYCSDDTSCSSVELVWSRPAATQATPSRGQLELERRPRQSLLANTRRRQLLEPPSDSPSSSDLNLSSSACSNSPIRPASPLVRPELKRAQPPDVAPNLSSWRALELPRPSSRAAGRVGGRSIGSDLSNCSSNSRCPPIVCQKPSILELAKPSRARDRRIGRSRNVAQRPEPYPSSQQTPKQMLRALEIATRRPMSASSWQPNPLFGRFAASPMPERVEISPIHEASSRSSASNKSPTPRLEKLKVKQIRSCDEPAKEEDSSLRAGLLRRHSSVAEDLHRKQPPASSGESAAKSSRFMSFLKRLKSRQEPTNSTTIEGDNFNVPNSDSISMSGLGLERSKRHRWSLRMRSAFTTSSGGRNGYDNVAGPQDHAFVNQMSANLDKLKSQISGTSKRASNFAEQLITSIKDTTKEQLLMATTGTTTRGRCDDDDGMQNSFATTESSLETVPPLVSNRADMLNVGTNERKAKMFPLIYMHHQQQQLQADGRPVITRQPVASIGRPLHHLARANSQRGASWRQKQRPQSIAICQQDRDQVQMDLDDSINFALAHNKDLNHNSDAIKINVVLASKRGDSLDLIRRRSARNLALNKPTCEKPVRRRSSCTV